jgi:protein TonB
MARIDDVVATTIGAGADERLAAIAERRAGRVKVNGLDTSAFAPLTARAGMFMAMDFARIGAFAGAAAGEAEGTAGAAEGPEHRPPELSAGDRSATLVLGLHAEGDRAALDIAFPLVLLEMFGRNDDAAEPVWPAPPTPPTERQPELSSSAAVPDQSTTLPKLVRKVHPVYPEAMRRQRLESKIFLQATISTEGTVIDAVVLRCDGKRRGEPFRGSLDPVSPLCTAFSSAAIDAVRQWRYEPARKDGTPVAVYFTVVVDFELGW